MLVASEAAFLQNYLAVGTWILDGSSIECHEKTHQRFSLSGVKFESHGRPKFLGGNLLGAGAVENEFFTLLCEQSLLRSSSICLGRLKGTLLAGYFHP